MHRLDASDVDAWTPSRGNTAVPCTSCRIVEAAVDTSFHSVCSGDDGSGMTSNRLKFSRPGTASGEKKRRSNIAEHNSKVTLLPDGCLLFKREEWLWIPDASVSRLTHRPHPETHEENMMRGKSILM